MKQVVHAKHQQGKQQQEQQPSSNPSSRSSSILIIPSRKPSIVAPVLIPTECFNLGPDKDGKEGSVAEKEVQGEDKADQGKLPQHHTTSTYHDQCSSIPAIPSRKPSMLALSQHTQDSEETTRTGEESIKVQDLHHCIDNIDSIVKSGESPSEKRFAASSRTFGTSTTAGLTTTPYTTSPSLADHSDASSRDRLDKLLPMVPIRRPSASFSHLILDPLLSGSSYSSSASSGLYHDDESNHNNRDNNSNRQSISASTASNIWDSSEHTVTVKSTASSILDSSLLSSSRGLLQRGSSITSGSLGGSTIFEDSTIIDFGDSHTTSQPHYFNMLSNTSTILSESSSMHHSSSFEGSSLDTSSCFNLDPNPEQRFAPTLESVRDNNSNASPAGLIRGSRRSINRRSSMERRRERAMSIAKRHMYFSSMMSIEEADDISDSNNSGGGEEDVPLVDEHDEIDHSEEINHSGISIAFGGGDDLMIIIVMKRVKEGKLPCPIL